MNFISLEYLVKDLEWLVENCSLKVSKRLKRLEILYEILGQDTSKINHMKILKEKKIEYNKPDIDEFLANTGDTFRKTIKLPTIAKDDYVKKLFESELTSMLNQNLRVYELSYKIFSRLVNKLKRHNIFGKLIAQRKLIYVLKGSVAARLVLLAKFPQQKKKIDEAFKLGGDNDCAIILDPDLENYDELHTQLSDLIYKFMLDISGCSSHGIILQEAKKIKSVKIDDQCYDVKECEKHSFYINDGKLENIFWHNKKIIVSRNDNIEFYGDNGVDFYNFGLIRLKKAFTILGKKVSAEILDIAIIRRKQVNYREHFIGFQNGKYMIKGNFTNGNLDIEN